MGVSFLVDQSEAHKKAGEVGLSPYQVQMNQFAPAKNGDRVVAFKSKDSTVGYPGTINQVLKNPEGKVFYQVVLDHSDYCDRNVRQAITCSPKDIIGMELSALQKGEAIEVGHKEVSFADEYTWRRATYLCANPTNERQNIVINHYGKVCFAWKDVTRRPVTREMKPVAPRAPIAPTQVNKGFSVNAGDTVEVNYKGEWFPATFLRNVTRNGKRTDEFLVTFHRLPKAAENTSTELRELRLRKAALIASGMSEWSRSAEMTEVSRKITREEDKNFPALREFMRTCQRVKTEDIRAAQEDDRKLGEMHRLDHVLGGFEADIYKCE